MNAPATIEQLKFEHQENAGKAERLRETIITQLLALFQKHNLTLGVPIESRVKTWLSIEEKLRRKPKEITSIHALDDLIGVRAIFLFRDDLDMALKIIPEHFEIHSAENASDRLRDSEFGYQSQHFGIKLPASWLSVPSLSGLGDFMVELQLRTLAQHIWAAASHKLQYKMESAVPPPMRRSIYRVSALLETVDLEFSRVLEERNSYINRPNTLKDDNAPLDVENLVRALDEVLPKKNKSDNEKYSDLLGDLAKAGVNTPAKVKALIRKNIDTLLKVEQRNIEGWDYKKGGDLMVERLQKGVFFAHCGLARVALTLEYGTPEEKSFFERPLSTSAKSR